MGPLSSLAVYREALPRASGPALGGGRRSKRPQLAHWNHYKQRDLLHLWHTGLRRVCYNLLQLFLPEALTFATGAIMSEMFFDIVNRDPLRPTLLERHTTHGNL